MSNQNRSNPKTTPARRKQAAEEGGLLEPVYAAVRKQAGKGRQDDAVAFAQAFYQRMGEDELPMHSADGWAALANDFLDFARVRKHGSANVRLFNPNRKQHGWETSHTVLQIINDDMPFLVDSVTMALAERGIGVHVLGHPVVRIGRDRSGKLTEVCGDQGGAESMMHLEIDRQSPEDVKRIEAEIRTVLDEVRGVVRDWPAMRERMLEVADDLGERQLPVDDAGRKEAQEFLRWAAADHFTFLGYREYEAVKKDKTEVLAAVEGSGLGLLHGADRGKSRALKSLAAYSMPQSGALDALILTKTNARARIHRNAYMDYIGVLSFDAKGRPIAEERFIGLYTSGAYNRRPWDIPIIRQRFDYVMRESGLKPDSHSGKALKHILETLPRDELFQTSETDLLKLATGILGLQERVRSKLFLRQDRYGRFWSALIYLPRDRYNTDVRRRIERLLQHALHADRVDANVLLSDSPLAQLHVVARPEKGASINIDPHTLERELAEVLRNWQDDLREELVQAHGDERGLELAQRYARALPAGYIEEVSPMQVASDIERLDALQSVDDLALSLHRNSSGKGSELRFKFYRKEADIPLSDALPIMENMGLRVITEHPYQIRVENRDGAEENLFIQDFEIESVSKGLDIETLSPRFEEAFLQVWRGQAENDGFNRLVLTAGLDWRQVAMLRGYGKYLQQIGVPFSQSYIEDTFSRHPLLAALVVELFQARFDPRVDDAKSRADTLADQLQALSGGDKAASAALRPVLDACDGPRSERCQAVHKVLQALLDGVSSLDEDRILRSFIGVIDATLRTNYYIEYRDGLRADGGPADYLSFKFDSSAVPDLPKPRPYREIFVYGPRVEGTHLRFGPVARGGLRWSDRREDFRTEVLGLVKAQMVKNTVIVPVGSKGGFICKQLPDPALDRDAWFAEGVACYKRFINGLLDITDNIAPNGKIVPPKNVVRHDDDDPYLVVAADKGTATFSDIANGIARAHGFWLDDAFASGGSVGYDHKGMGITARGAWESVKRHFRALGVDSQKQDFTCVGIGDMSGDVFGNGMLLSKHIRLIAAFDHRHIFVDPDPDAATSFKERSRLFKLPRSSWDDYDKTLISKGGGVWPRSLKSIPVSAQMRTALGLDTAVNALSPNELMSAILKAPVDLLWNGGIGTYVKGSGQNNADVGDRANNALRVDGRDLRCKIVGEGGNLGATQLGRVEAALNGVLLNTDFIDNSAGVDTSDHEVNIKILLNGEVQKKKLGVDARNKMLAAMTDEVAGLVLNDNYRQNQTLSLMERMGRSHLGSKMHFMQQLEQQGLLDRQIEYLPSDAEINERKTRGQSLTRPELAVLLSYAKLVAFQQLLDSDVPEDRYLSKELIRYFPEPLQKKYAKAMEGHRLKREIIATAVTNSTINRMGATFLMRMQEDSGRSIGEVAKAYTITRETMDARELWAQIDALDNKVAETTQIDALQAIWSLQRTFTRWLLSRPGQIPDITSAVERYHGGMRDIRRAEGVLPDSLRPAYEAGLHDWKSKGVPDALGSQLAALPYMDPVPDIVELARERKLKAVDVAKVYFRVAEALHAPWLREQIEALQVEGRWHAVARGVLRDQLSEQLRKLTGQALSMAGADAAAKVKAWLERDDTALRFTLAMLNELAAQEALDYPTASVAVQRLSQLAERG